MKDKKVFLPKEEAEALDKFYKDLEEKEDRKNKTSEKIQKLLEKIRQTDDSNEY